MYINISEKVWDSDLYCFTRHGQTDGQLEQNNMFPHIWGRHNFGTMTLNCYICSKNSTQKAEIPIFYDEEHKAMTRPFYHWSCHTVRTKYSEDIEHVRLFKWKYV